MTTDRVRIAVDAMGSDSAPLVEVQGALAAAAGGELDVVLVGDEARLRPVLDEAGPAALSGRVQIRHAPEVVGMDEAPVIAFKHKKASSMRVCFDLAKAGEVDAVVSAGNSGALMAGALFVLGRIEGLDRPAILTSLPTMGDPCVMLDMGANVDPRPGMLAQFAVIGATYARLVHGKPRPRVGLLSNGAEEHKGTALTREAHLLLTRQGPGSGQHPGFDYLGYVEGRDIFRGQMDVVVTDGFTGNVVLKSCEGLVDWLIQTVKDEVGRSGCLTRLGAGLMRPALRRFRGRTDYAETGGAPLVGVDGVVLICHGASDARAIKNAVASAARFARVSLRRELSCAVSEHSYVWRSASLREDEPAPGA
jgi:glycerol-3-phosphate acyltransferase PlsX